MNSLFPIRPDTYTHHPLARWVLPPITVVTIARSLIHFLALDVVGQTAFLIQDYSNLS